MSFSARRSSSLWILRCRSENWVNLKASLTKKQCWEGLHTRKQKKPSKHCCNGSGKIHAWCGLMWKESPPFNMKLSCWFVKSKPKCWQLDFDHVWTFLRRQFHVTVESYVGVMSLKTCCFCFLPVASEHIFALIPKSTDEKKTPMYILLLNII